MGSSGLPAACPPRAGRRAAVSATISGRQAKDINMYSRNTKVTRFRKQQQDEENDQAVQRNRPG